MQVGIFAKTFAGGVGEVLGASAAAGYDGVAWNMACSGLEAMPAEVTPEVVAEVVAAARAAGQQIMSLSGTYNMIHPDPAVRVRGHARLEVLARVAPALGTRLITLCTGTRDAADQWRHHAENGSVEAWGDLMDSFKIAVQIAEKNGVFLGVEPELANVVNGAAAARRLLDELQSDRVKIVLDPANLFEVSADPSDVIDRAVDVLGPDIAMAHAKDRDPAGGFATAGKGVVDFPRFLRRLRQVGFDGPLVTHGLTAGEAAGTAAYLRGLV
jgi:sugar phosphate isomerase/epimerase